MKKILAFPMKFSGVYTLALTFFVFLTPFSTTNGQKLIYDEDFEGGMLPNDNYDNSNTSSDIVDADFPSNPKLDASSNVIGGGKINIGFRIQSGGYFRIDDYPAGGEVNKAATGTKISNDNKNPVSELIQWRSREINIGCYKNVYFNVDAISSFINSPNDGFVRISYQAYNSGDTPPIPPTPFTTINGNMIDTRQTISSDGTVNLNPNYSNDNCAGRQYDRLVIIIEVFNKKADDTHGFDNVQVWGTEVVPEITNIPMSILNCSGATLSVNVKGCNTFYATRTLDANGMVISSTSFQATGLTNGVSGVLAVTIPALAINQTFQLLVRNQGNTGCTSVAVNVTADIDPNDITMILSTCTATLPIQLLTFTGRAREDHVLLTWQTASEEDNDYMAVERSGDGAFFDEIGRVAGKGTTDELQTYNFIDRAPAAGVNYYRLRQVDFDGTTEYHPVIAVQFGGQSRLSLAVAPNPVGELLNVNWNAPGRTDARVRVLDLQGRQHSAQEVGNGSGLLNLPVNELPAGVYFLQIVQGSGVETVRFVKR